MENMEHDFMGRGYLLPAGCKDLIDVLKLKARQPPDPAHLLRELLKSKQPLPPVVGEIVIPEKTSASQLAALLGQKPFQIVADILELRVLATLNEPLSFEIISKVARKYGFLVIKAAY